MKTIEQATKEVVNEMANSVNVVEFVKNCRKENVSDEIIKDALDIVAGMIAAAALIKSNN